MEDRLYIKLYQLRRRQAWVQAVHYALKAGLWGAWVSLLLVLLLGQLGLPHRGDVLQGLWAWPGAALVGFVYGLLRPMSLRQVAHAADRQHQLQERLLTCYGQLERQRLNSQDRHGRTGMTRSAQLLLHETLSQLDPIDPRKTFPNRWVRPALRWLVPALCLGLLMVGAPYWLRRPAAGQDADVVAARQRLNRVAEQLRRRPNSAAARKLEQLLRRMPQQVAGQAARQLQRERNQAQQREQRQNAQAGQAAGIQQTLGQNKTGQEKQALQQLEQLQRKVDSQHAAQPSLEKAQKALQQGQRQAAQEALQQAEQQLAQGAEDDAALAEGLAQELESLDPGQRLAQGDGEGSEGQGQNGQGGEKGQAGTGQQQGKGAGKPGQPGNGPGGGDFGQGTTNQAEGQHGNATAKHQNERQHRRTSKKRGRFEQLYGVERAQLQGRREQIALKGGRNGKLLLMPDSRLGQALTDTPVLRPEQRVFLEARADAEQAVAEERIPSQHREAVRRYFDQIDPR